MFWNVISAMRCSSSPEKSVQSVVGGLVASKGTDFQVRKYAWPMEARSRNGQLPPPARREQILRTLSGGGFVRVNELAELLGVSDVTVRGDLAALAERGEVRRIHGGAIGNASGERSFEDASGAHTDEKWAIGGAAAQLISS